MNKKLQVAFPSGNHWVTHEGGVQSLEVNKDEVTYIWDYSCNEDKDENDPKVGSEKKRYYGEKTMQFKFLSGIEFSYNGSRLGEVGDFENETLKLLLNLNRITNVQ